MMKLIRISTLLLLTAHEFFVEANVTCYNCGTPIMKVILQNVSNYHQYGLDEKSVFTDNCAEPFNLTEISTVVCPVPCSTTFLRFEALGTSAYVRGCMSKLLPEELLLNMPVATCNSVANNSATICFCKTDFCNAADAVKLKNLLDIPSPAPQQESTTSASLTTSTTQEQKESVPSSTLTETPLTSATRTNTVKEETKDTTDSITKNIDSRQSSDDESSTKESSTVRTSQKPVTSTAESKLTTTTAPNSATTNKICWLLVVALTCIGRGKTCIIDE